MQIPPSYETSLPDHKSKGKTLSHPRMKHVQTVPATGMSHTQRSHFTPHIPTFALLRSLSSAPHSSVPMSERELSEEAESWKKTEEALEKRKRYFVEEMSKPRKSILERLKDEEERGHDSRPFLGRRSMSMMPRRRSADIETGMISGHGREGQQRELTPRRSMQNVRMRPRTSLWSDSDPRSNEETVDRSGKATLHDQHTPHTLHPRANTVSAIDLQRYHITDSNSDSTPAVPTTKENQLTEDASTLRTQSSSNEKSKDVHIEAISTTPTGRGTVTGSGIGNGSVSSPSSSNEPDLSPRRQQIIQDVTDLFCSRPSNAIFDRSWNVNAIFEDPLTYCKNREEWSAQWFGLPKVFPESKQLEMKILESTGGSGVPGQIKYEQTQQYTAAGLHVKKVSDEGIFVLAIFSTGGRDSCSSCQLPFFSRHLTSISHIYQLLISCRSSNRSSLSTWTATKKLPTSKTVGMGNHSV